MIVTGASRGIGAATARLAARRGFAVCVNYRAAEVEAEAVVDAIVGEGGRAVAVRADVSSESEIRALFAAAREHLGRVTALVNNAGILERQSTLADMEADRIARVLAVNVTGAFLCAREAVRTMSTARGGSGGAIVNVSSVAAALGGAREYIDYAASKGAIDTLTLGLAREVGGEGIRVNAVRPGIIYTDIHASGGEPGRVDRIGPTLPMGRGGQPEEVAEAIVWLASDLASYVTASFIDVAGGR